MQHFNLTDWAGLASQLTTDGNLDVSHAVPNDGGSTIAAGRLCFLPLPTVSTAIDDTVVTHAI